MWGMFGWGAVEPMPPASTGFNQEADAHGNVVCERCLRPFPKGTLHDGNACSSGSAHSKNAVALAEQVGGEVVVSTEGVPIVVFPEDVLSAVA